MSFLFSFLLWKHGDQTSNSKAVKIFLICKFSCRPGVSWVRLCLCFILCVLRSVWALMVSASFLEFLQRGVQVCSSFRSQSARTRFMLVELKMVPWWRKGIYPGNLGKESCHELVFLCYVEWTIFPCHFTGGKILLWLEILIWINLFHCGTKG